MKTIRTPRWQHVVSLLLALCMALTLLSIQALAAPGGEDKPDTPADPTVLSPTLADETVTYTGDPMPYHGAEGLEGISAAAVSYAGRDGMEYPETSAAPTNAGTYTVTAALTPDEGYLLADGPYTALLTIEKAAQDTPAASLEDRSAHSLTVTAIPGAEYSMDGGGTWQDEPQFTGLTSNTAYTFSMRLKETDNYLSSDSRTVEGKTLTDTGLTYEIDFHWEAIHFDPAVVEMGKDKKLTSPLPDGVAVEPGMTVYMRLVDGGTGEPGPVVTVQLPERPEAPDVTVDLRDLTADTTRDMEYSINGGKNWARCVPDMDVSSLIGKKFLVREAAATDQFASEAAELSVPARGEKPSITLDTVAKTISTTVGMDCSIDGGKTWEPCTGPLDVSGLTGKELLVRFSASETAPPSEPATVKVPARRNAPSVGHTDETRRGRSDGTLTNTSRTMEYRLTPNGKWTAITSSTVTGLAPGIYEVRYGADDTSFVSQTQPVVITKGGDLPGSRLFLLNRDSHTAYIAGRTSTQAAPNADITRAEVATILYRLLTQEAKADYGTSVSPFRDVPGNAWYSSAAATLANMDVLSIYQGGTFEPNRSITRGELAAVLSRFCGTAETSGRDHFSDISGNWARDAINLAAEAGLVYGYTDGTFRPDQTITRAETIVMFNRILGRSVQAGTVLSGYRTFQDVPANAWYYWDIVEASNSHGHSMDGSTEKWTALG